MRLRRALQSLALGLVASCVAASAGAQENLTIQFSEGRVTLSAQNVSLSRILEEWARVGGTRILKVTNLDGPPVTVQFTGMAEPQALSVLLEGVAGYILSRRPEAFAGTSAFEQILVVPTSSPIAESTSVTAQPRVGVRLPPPPFVRARAMRPEQPDAGNADPSHDDPTIPVWMPDFARSSGGGARIVPPWVAGDRNPSESNSQTETDAR
jgi:hypothetical protein